MRVVAVATVVVTAATIIFVTAVARSLVALLDGRSTNRTGIMLLQPQNHAFLVKPMLAGKKHGGVALLHLIDADGAFGLAIWFQHLLIHGFPFQISESLVCGRWSSIRLRISLH